MWIHIQVHKLIRGSFDQGIKGVNDLWIYALDNSGSSWGGQVVHETATCGSRIEPSIPGGAFMDRGINIYPGINMDHELR